MTDLEKQEQRDKEQIKMYTSFCLGLVTGTIFYVISVFAFLKHNADHDRIYHSPKPDITLESK